MWTCILCDTVWPAMTTLEAFKKRQRANEKHPGEPCREESA